jgi:hypothetical protein
MTINQRNNALSISEKKKDTGNRARVSKGLTAGERERE